MTNPLHMPEVAIFGDTHVPSREQSILDQVRERVRDADEVIHVGDFDEQSTLETVEDLAANLTAVHANLDPDGIGLPTVATLDVEGVRFVVTHGTGSPAGWMDRVVETALEQADPGRTTVAVAGHIHEVVDREHGGVRLLNPGSATGARPAEGESVLTVGVSGDEIDVEAHRQ